MARNGKPAPIGLLTLRAHERLDTGATGSAGAGDPPMATVGTLHRPANGSGQSPCSPQRVHRRSLASGARAAQDLETSALGAAAGAAEDLNGPANVFEQGTEKTDVRAAEKRSTTSWWRGPWIGLASRLELN